MTKSTFLVSKSNIFFFFYPKLFFEWNWETSISKSTVPIPFENKFYWLLETIADWSTSVERNKHVNFITNKPV